MQKFRIQTYTLSTLKLRRPVRFAILSDLHGCAYGEKQSALLGAVARQHPDAVLMTGDMVDIRGEETPFWDLLEGAAGIAPCYYVTGNHDYHGHTGSQFHFSKEEVEKKKERIRALGIQVLEGEKRMLEGSGEPVAIMGIDDVFAGQQRWDRQYLRCCRQTKAREYTILLSHRPDLAGAYRYFPGDLVICGHAHGGQWRLPGARGGVYAPGQGLFPRYAGGLYPRGQGKLLVSCGLCYRYPRIPRFGNPPELVMLQIEPRSARHANRAGECGICE